MKNYLRALILFSFANTFALAQAPTIGTPEWAALHSQVSRNDGPVINPLSGNDTLTAVYNNTACGLNYVTVSQRLGQRFIPLGIPQPAPFIVNISPCAVIQQAFLYTEVLGVTPSVTANITNPASVSTAFNMTNIGSSVDVCWGMNGTHVWRTDVTSCITGPGTYTLSGLPTNIAANSSTADCEGATLIIIYVDPYASYTGTLKIDDGCHTVAGGNMNHTMTGFSACANSTFANSFMLVGDMQMPGYTLNMNNNSVTQPQWDWWNEISASTTVTNGQSTCNFDLGSGGDCYTLAAAGLYYQNGCSGCTPLTTPISLLSTSTPDNCNSNGTVAVSATGGSGTYTYLWIPGGYTTSSVTGLPAGTYTVWVNDGITCNSAQAVVQYTGMNLVMSATPVTCNSNGSASVSVTGGQAPYTYLWSPSGGTASTASNLTPGWYSITVTDSSGCNMTDSIEVIQNTTLGVSIWSSPDSCNTGIGTANAYVSGGTAPYTYLWAPGGQTTSSITGQFAGTYSVTVTDSSGCTQSAWHTIGTSNIILFGGTQFISCGDSITLYPYLNLPNAIVSWSPSTYLSNPSIHNPICFAPFSMTYTITATNGCMTTTDTMNVVFDSTNYYYDAVCFVTVDTVLNKNVVIWERTNSPSAGNYNIYRETSAPGVYALIATQSISQFTTFTDMTSTPSINADRYKITSVNLCGDESDSTGHHRTIFLVSTQNGPVWDLAWTAYEGLWISTYNIYRGASVGTMTFLTSVSGSTFTYTDASPLTGINYYMVEAVHPNGGCTPSLRLSDPQQVLDNSSVYSNISTAVPNGISENDFYGVSFTLLPNPGNGNIQLNISLIQAQEIRVIVFDNLGRNVYSQNENASAGTYSSIMNLSSLSSGVYSVQVLTTNGFAVKQLVIE